MDQPDWTEVARQMQTTIDALRKELAEAKAALARTQDASLWWDQYNLEVRKHADTKAALAVKITSAEINAMPPHVRGYIAALETACDPNGTIRENYTMREENRGLRTECINLSASLEATNARIAELDAQNQRMFNSNLLLTNDNEVLRKELADMRRPDWKVAHIKELEGQLTERRDRVDDLDKELAEAKAATEDYKAAATEEFNNCSAVEAKLEASNVRIASLMTGADRYWEQRWRAAEARIAELEEQLQECWQRNLKLSNATTARAERAEAECKALRETLELLMTENGCSCFNVVLCIAEACDEEPKEHNCVFAAARATLNPSPAEQETSE